MITANADTADRGKLKELPAKHYAFADTKLARYLTTQIDAISDEKSQREIAAEIGYEKPNMISMFKRGEAKVPLDKIPGLAKALHVDPAHMLRLAMEQYWPELYHIINDIFGGIATKNQRAIYMAIQKECGEKDPELTHELRKALHEAFQTYKASLRPAARRIVVGAHGRK
jgi:transcriptional regulator with XRE-family HTH domain